MPFKFLLPPQPMTSKRRMQYPLHFVGYRRIYQATIGCGRSLTTWVVELAVNSYLIKPKRNYFSKWSSVLPNNIEPNNVYCETFIYFVFPCKISLNLYWVLYIHSYTSSRDFYKCLGFWTTFKFPLFQDHLLSYCIIDQTQFYLSICQCM